MLILEVNDNIALKLIATNDADELYNLVNVSRQYLREWLPWVDGTHNANSLKAFIQDCLMEYSENKSLTCVILFNEAIAGVISFNLLNWSNRTAYIGYWLGEAYQGKGIMTKAVNAMTNYAINDLKLNKVEIRAAVENTKSRRVPERLGFVNEGIIRQTEWLYDHYVDHIIYGVLASEWNQKSSI